MTEHPGDVGRGRGEPVLGPVAPPRLLRSSVDLGWESLLVEEIVLPPGDTHAGPPTSHGVCLSMALTEGTVVRWEGEGREIRHRLERGHIQLTTSTAVARPYRFLSRIEMLHLEMTPQLLHRTAPGRQLPHEPQLRSRSDGVLDDSHIRHIGLALLAELRDGAPTGRPYADALAVALAIHLHRRYGTAATATLPPGRPLRPEVRRAVDYIDQNLEAAVDSGLLATMSNLSVSHFHALFTQDLGLPPRQYILRQRVRRARELLLSTDLPVARVATSVGFYDQSHLSRHMRRLLDTTPGTLRHQRNVHRVR